MPDSSESEMNGAESVVRTLLASGVDTCFANPGTSEMHFVAALDRIPGMRCVLGLAENVVSGAADGYYRMAERPAATLLHCGPGFANAWSNLHNAYRARSGVINIVGDQATYHSPLDAPLTSNTAALAGALRGAVLCASSVATAGAEAAAMIEAARVPPGAVATLILPADLAWSAGGRAAVARPSGDRANVEDGDVAAAVSLLRADGPSIVLLLGGTALRAGAMADAHRIAAATGAKVIGEMQNARVEHGRGRLPIRCLPYHVDAGRTLLAHAKHLLLIGSRKPVAFFAHPGKPGTLYAENTVLHRVAGLGDDCAGALARIAEALGAPNVEVPNVEVAEGRTMRQVTSLSVGQTVAAAMPENAIVVEESISFGRDLFPAAAGAAPHDWLQLTGGAIGEGLPLMVGAAIGAPGRRVIGLQADGSAMYSVSALWTMSHEQLDITIIVLANRKYAILLDELAAVGAVAGKTALGMMDLSNPALDWVRIAEGMGMEAARASNCIELDDLLRSANARPGPFLIELSI